MVEYKAAWAAGLAAFLISLSLTPWTARIARRIGALDVPRDTRRMHKHPVPRIGGLALFCAFVVCTSVSGLAADRLIPLLWGATLLALLGLFDDVLRLRAPLKLCVQLIASAVTLGGGGGWDRMWLGGRLLYVGSLRFGLGVLWLLLLINAHNMIDGMDGLAAGISALEAVSLSLVALSQGNGPMLCLAASLVGACLGYLPYNRHPARVFMGDTGSQLLGLALGAVCLQMDVPAAGALGALVPLLVFALPLSDLVFAVVRRVANGQSPFAADRGHWHHRLSDAGLGQRQVCLWLYLLCGAMGAVAVLLCREAWYGYAAYATLGALGIVLMLETRLWQKRMWTKKG